MDLINKIAPKPGFIRIDGYEVPVREKEITNANIIKVEVGTNGIRGGDSGHGSRTHFAIENVSSTDMKLAFDGGDAYCGHVDVGDVRMKCREGMHGCEIQAERIEIEFGGDDELDSFVEALEFAVATLKEQRGY